MRFFRLLYNRDSRHQQLIELYRTSEDGGDVLDSDPAAREMFEADKELTDQLSQMASSIPQLDASSEREALLSRVAEKRSLRQNEEVPMLRQVFQKRALAAAGAAVLVLGAAATVGAAGGVSDVAGNVNDVLAALQITSGSSTVEVCHVPDDNPDNPHTISVGESAVDEHLAHGDTAGVCSETEPVGSPDGVGPSDNVEVCHAPSDSADNPHTISVAASAVDEHLAHGDIEGVCANESSPGAPDSTGPSDRFEVCHTLADNPDNQHTLSVPQDALDRHLAHGDNEGACVGEEQQNGPPADVPNGPSEDVPQGPPDGVPQGPPEQPGQSTEDHGNPGSEPEPTETPEPTEVPEEEQD